MREYRFVLVHGSWHHGGLWKEVADQLVQMCMPAFKDRGAIYKYAPTGLFKFKR